MRRPGLHLSVALAALVGSLAAVCGVDARQAPDAAHTSGVAPQAEALAGATPQRDPVKPVPWGKPQA